MTFKKQPCGLFFNLSSTLSNQSKQRWLATIKRNSLKIISHSIKHVALSVNKAMRTLPINLPYLAYIRYSLAECD